MTIFITVFLVLLSGLFSGLTLGLLGLDATDLERKKKLGDKRAKKIHPIRRDGNLLLCTLLLGNVAVNTALAIFLGSIASGVIAGVIATGLIVIFGEIIPQATVSRYALDVGARTIWIVYVFRFIFYPVAKPIAFVLDKSLGAELPTIWNRRELEMIIQTHEDSPHSSIDQDEERIMLGALHFSHKEANDIMTPRKMVYAIGAEEKLTKKKIREIKNKGFTRIPVYQNSLENITGVLYSKDLLGLIDHTKTAQKLARTKTLLQIQEYVKLDELLNTFLSQNKKVHMALVFNEFKTFVGLVTLEDVVEEIIGREIVDETDSVVNLRKEARK